MNSLLRTTRREFKKDNTEVCPSELTKLTDKIKNQQPALDSLYWKELIDQICLECIPAYKFDDTTVQHLASTIDGMDNLDSLLKPLTQYPLGTFSSINQVPTLDNKSILQTDLKTIKQLLFDFFLELLNSKLQNLYRLYLSAIVSGTDNSHTNNLSALMPLEKWVYYLLEQMNIEFLSRWLSPDAQDLMLEEGLKQLSNYFFNIKQVNFRFTHHCNITCRHCYNHSGPRAKPQSLNVKDMCDIIYQMPVAGIQYLNITGGEPFLYMDKICGLIKAARKAELSGISIFTNGFWAKSREEADNRLEQLKQAGFMKGAEDSLKMSSGEFHQEFIPPERIFILAEAYYRIFNKKLVLDYEARNMTFELKKQLLGTFIKRKSGHCVNIKFRNIRYAGRAHDIKGIQNCYDSNSACKVINQIVFEPDGSVKPCCGLNAENFGINIGHLKQDKLTTLIKSMQNDPILQYLSINRLSSIYHIRNKERSVPEYYGICAVCQDVIGDLHDKKKLQNILTQEQEFYPFHLSTNKLKTFKNLTF